MVRNFLTQISFKHARQPNNYINNSCLAAKTSILRKWYLIDSIHEILIFKHKLTMLANQDSFK